MPDLSVEYYRKNFKVGSPIHYDTFIKESPYTRYVGDGIVLRVDRTSLLVESHTHRENMFVPKCDAWVRINET